MEFQLRKDLAIEDLGATNMIQVFMTVMTVVLAIGPVQEPDSAKPAKSKPAVSRTPTAELRIGSGMIRGLVIGEHKDVNAYKGIPYAAPPTGERRWKPPQPVAAWDGVRDCFDFGAACPQKMPALFASIPEMAIHEPLSEDCLFVNVWTPAKRPSEKLPVLYWIHGGGFVMGSASQPLYDGEELARLGCVVVSINYRLGAFGFMAHPALSQESNEKVSGNYGLLDQIEGLRWVNRNISAFGGDLEHVAIFGESAGGMSVLCLMVAPEAKGLFHAAICQSAAVMNMVQLREPKPGQESAEQAGQRLIAACGLDSAADAAKLRQLDAKDLLKASPQEPGPGGPVRMKPLALQLGPIVDGHVIPDNPDVLFGAGREHAVPLIVGNTREEMSVFLIGSKLPADAAEYMKKLEDEFGDQAKSVATAYPATDAGQIKTAVIQLVSDMSFVRETRHIARTHSSAGQKAFRYQFSRGTNRGFLKALGAHHGSELAYVFGRPSQRDDESSMRLCRTIGQYWINLAASGDPNSAGLPPWPAYRTDGEETLEFADQVQVLKGPGNDRLDVIEKVLHAPR
jgi:para-nitrobenzyl esterase